MPRASISGPGRSTRREGVRANASRPGRREGGIPVRHAVIDSDEAQGRKDRALRMLCRAHLLKGARNFDRNTFAGTAKALLDGRALETIPILEYVWEKTNRVLTNEELLRGRERVDGRHGGEERSGRCGVLGRSRQGTRMANDIDRWCQGPPG